jgi:glycosyltransferase involved in cell wall biosynthesis
VSNVKISVVSPVYNEYEVLPYLLDALPKALVKLTDHYEIILVDDGSTDGSDRVIRERAESDRLRSPRGWIASPGTLWW